ncbi:MAG: chorismate mutase [Schleiferiaceae bacterium]
MNAAARHHRPFGPWNPEPGQPWVIAGPCSAESLEQVLETARALKADGRTQLFRAGVWKPRTRPGAFEGAGYNALEWLQIMRAEVGLPFVVEVGNPQHVERALAAGADAVWLGARTTVNPFYVQEIAEALQGSTIPVLVKNPIHADLGLWIGAIERLNKAGIQDLAAVHRGFFATHSEPYRNDPRWELTFALRRHAPELPIICDPSHIAGQRDLVESVAQIAMDLALDGLMIEIHPQPDEALSDSAQQLTPARLTALLDRLARYIESADPAALAQSLSTDREALDRIDAQFVDLIQQRQAIVERLAHRKLEQGASVFQMDRWLDMLEQREAQAQTQGLDPNYVKAFFELVHRYSVQHQAAVYQSQRRDDA